MKSTGSVKLILIVAGLLCLGGGTIAWRQSLGRSVDRFARAVTAPVTEGEFISSVNEVGEVESSSNLEVRCKVRSRGREGTVILDIVPEGTEVKPGDYLCQLDDSLMRDELVEHQIQVATDEAAVIQAKSDLATAAGMLLEFQNGIAAQEIAALEAEKALAEENRRRAGEYLVHSRVLNRKGYITRTQLEADEFAVEKAEQDFKLAEQKLSVYENYTRARMEEGFQLEIEKQTATLAAAEFTLKLSQQRRDESQTQIDSCKVVAPAAGTVIYASENDDGDTTFVVEEGAAVREGQPIIFLPDPHRMQVRATVSESKVNRVRKGQEVQVRLDSAPEVPLTGVVRSIASYPLPRRWFQAPIEYEVLVDVTNPTEEVRTGLRAKVEILVERFDQARQAPLSAIVAHQNGRFVLVRNQQGVTARPVQTSSHNDRFVIIEEGVETGEEVLLDPENYRDAVSFPSTSQITAGQPGIAPAAAPTRPIGP